MGKSNQEIYTRMSNEVKQIVKQIQQDLLKKFLADIAYYVHIWWIDFGIQINKPWISLLRKKLMWLTSMPGWIVTWQYNFMTH